jgi:hypothetical protein
MRLASIAVASALAAAAVQPAAAASLLEMNFWLSGPNYSGVVPYCEDPAVTEKIAYRFAQKEREYWNSALTIQTFERPREIAFRPWGESYIPRRFCTGLVVTSDGRRRDVSYVIGEDLGFVGVSWGVEWCVAGLDRNLAYAPGCKMARP